MNGQILRDKIQSIRIKMLKGQISYDEAKKEARPVIDEINRLAAEIAKKYNKKPQKFNFTELMR